jgi:hypothetical protein
MSSRRQWERARGFCLGLAALVLASAGCDVKVGDEGGLSVDFTAGKATDEWVRTYDIKPGGRLDIINVNGQIEASLSSGAQVEVRAVREARAGSEEASRELLRKSEMREEVTPDRVTIQAPEDGERGRGFRRAQLTIKYDVRIPKGLNVMLKTQNGEVRLDNIEGPRIEVASTNGGISGRGVSGAVEASTVNGGIQMDMQAVTGETRMVTVNGGVLLGVGPGVNADLEATVVNGGVSVQDGLSLSGDERSRQRVAGRIGSGGPRLLVQTTNGGVRIGPRGAPGP